MGVKLLLIVAGIGIGIIATLIILRKDIFKVINYHDGLRGVEDEHLLRTTASVGLANMHSHLPNEFTRYHYVCKSCVMTKSCSTTRMLKYAKRDQLVLCICGEPMKLEEVANAYK